MKKACILWACLGIICAQAGGGGDFSFPRPPSNRQDDLAAKMKTIESWYDAADDPEYLGGYAVAFIKDGRVLLKKTYGRANEEYRIPFTSRTVFDFASIAKQFTGFAAAKLVLEGRLSLDDAIKKHLPELPDWADKITIRQLLNHTSGLRDWVALMRLAGRMENDNIARDWIYKTILRQESGNFTPGERSAYSNSGYFLLAEMIARMTGKSFREWAKDNVFLPLGMNSTFVLDSLYDIVPEGASSYLGKNKSCDLLSAPGCSSLWSTLDDMIKWLINLDTHAVGGNDVFKLMMSPSFLGNGEPVPYNFGLEQGSLAGKTFYTHGGGWCGFSSQMVYYPQEHLSMVFFSNRSPSGIALRQKALNLLLDIKAEPSAEGPLANADRPRSVIDTSIYARYVGDYALKCPSESRSYYLAKVFVKDGILVFDSPLYRNNRLYPISEDRFFIVGDTNEYTFLRNEGGQADKIMIRHGDKEYVFLRMETGASRIQEAEQIAGEYYSEELKEPLLISVSRDEDKLTIAGSLTNDHAHLYKVGDGLSGYVGSAWWCSDVVFTRDERQKINGFLITAAGENYAADIKYRKIR